MVLSTKLPCPLTLELAHYRQLGHKCITGTHFIYLLTNRGLSFSNHAIASSVQCSLSALKTTEDMPDEWAGNDCASFDLWCARNS